jgi:hypothetical protein
MPEDRASATRATPRPQTDALPAAVQVVAVYVHLDPHLTMDVLVRGDARAATRRCSATTEVWRT